MRVHHLYPKRPTTPDRLAKLMAQGVSFPEALKRLDKTHYDLIQALRDRPQTGVAQLPDTPQTLQARQAPKQQSAKILTFPSGRSHSTAAARAGAQNKAPGTTRPEQTAANTQPSILDLTRALSFPDQPERLCDRIF